MRNTVSLLIAQGVAFLYPVLAFPLVARSLDRATFGSLFTFFTIASVMSVLVEFGLNFEGTRLGTRRFLRGSTLVPLYLNAHLIKYLVLGALLLPALCLLCYAGACWPPSTVCIVSVMLVLPVASALSPLWLLQAVDATPLAAALTAGTRLLVLAWFLCSERTLFHALLLFVAPPLLTSFCSSLYVGVRFGLWRQPFPWRRRRCSSYLGTLFPAFYSNSTTLVYTSGGPLLLAALSGPVAVATYGACDRLIRPFLSVLGVVFQGIYPVACGSRDNTLLARRIVAAAELVLLPLVLAALWYARDILQLSYGKGYGEGAGCFRILLLLLVILPVAMAHAQLLLLAQGKGVLTARSYLAATALYVVCAPPLIYCFSAPGACAALVLVESLATLMLVAGAKGEAP